jgi:hypothetical protein
VTSRNLTSPGLDPGVLLVAGKKDRRVKPGEGERGVREGWERGERGMRETAKIPTCFYS